MRHSHSQRALLIGVLILAISLPALPVKLFLKSVQAQDPCEGLVAPRLAVGGSGRVLAVYGISLKNQPYTGAAGAEELALLPFGTVVAVLDGPRCNYGYVWWQVRLPDSTTGWIAEGNDTEYFMEPFTVGLYVYRPSKNQSRIRRYFVTPNGRARKRGAFTIEPVHGTAGEIWQQVEIDLLGQALDSLREICPDRLAETIWENVASLEDALQLPLPPLEYDFYPSPDGEQLVLVQHLHLELPRCHTVVPERIGISTVSLLDADGTASLLFPFPQHGSVPPSEDRYALSEQDSRAVYLDEVVWSPQGKYIAFVAAYQDLCGGQGCYRFHMYIWNLETGQLYIPGEGRHVGWTSGGEQINFFRLTTGADNGQSAHLYTMRPDGAARQEIWLPGGAVYVSDQQTPLGFPWNEGGTRVMVGNGGVAEVMLFNLMDRDFTPPIVLPDLAPQPNRLSVHPIKGEKALLWTTIRGNFVTQNVRTGEWTELASEVASTGVPILQVRPFASGDKALVEMADGTAYILDIDADQLTPVTFNE